MKWIDTRAVVARNSRYQNLEKSGRQSARQGKTGAVPTESSILLNVLSSMPKEEKGQVRRMNPLTIAR